MSRLACVLCAITACASQPSGPRGDASTDSDPESVLDGKADAAGFGRASYEMDPDRLVNSAWYKSEILYLELYAAGGNSWQGSVCTTYGCTTRVGEAGAYKLTKTSSGATYIRLYTSATAYSRYAYEDDGDTLWLRKTSTNDWVAMTKVPALWDESLCDGSSGSWTDDDLAPDGTNCVCGDGRVWLAATGCVDRN
jgi:hypothetical protein